MDYNPDQGCLLPPSVRDVLGEGHLCFFVRRVVAKLNLNSFRDEYGIEGGQAYALEMLALVWLYAYALEVTSSRRLEQRIRASDPAHRRLRRKLRDPAGRAAYASRKAIVEPVNGVLKEQRGMRRFRQRGVAKVAVEWTLTTTAYNLTRL